MTSESPPLSPIILPDLGTENEIVRVSSWLIDVGQTLVSGERIVEVLVPGITFDIEAGKTGELAEIVKPVESIVAPGDVLGWIEVY